VTVTPLSVGPVPVRIDALGKSFGRHPALAGVTLEIERGEVFGYLGPNGAGKTTTLRLLMGFLRPTSGQASIFGLDCWSAATEVHKQVGYVGGDVALYERMTGDELLRYLGALRGGVDEDYLAKLVARLDVTLDRPIRTLSTGNRAKLEAYECGIEPSPQAFRGHKMPVKYYLTAMLFIVFDIEIIFLYPWAVAFDKLGMFGLVEMLMFILTVFVVYAYVWRRGGLEWD